MSRQRFFLMILLPGLFLLLQNSLHAGEINWSNASGGDWSNPANWSTGQVPGPQDTVRITLAGTYDVRVQQAVTVASLTLGDNSSQPRLVIQANPSNGDGTLQVTRQLHSRATIVLSSTSSKSFYDAKLILKGARFINDTGAVVKIAAGSSGLGKRQVALKPGAVWDNRGRVEVLEYDAEFALSDTTARIINSGTITIDSSRTLVIHGGDFELATGTIDGTVRMHNIRLAAGSLSPAAHLLFLDSNNSTKGRIENHGIIEIRADDDFGNGSLALMNTLTNHAILRFNSTSTRDYYDAILELHADSLINMGNAEIQSLPGLYSVGERMIRLQPGVALENRGRINLKHSLSINIADTTASFRNAGIVAIEPTAVMSVVGGNFVPATGVIEGAVTFSSSHIYAGLFTDSARVTLGKDNVIKGELINQGWLSVRGINTLKSTLINRSSGAFFIEPTTNQGDATLKVEGVLQNYGYLGLSSLSDRSFYDALIDIISGRLQNFAGGFVEARPGTFGAGKRTLRLAAGTSFSNAGTVLVQQYDFSIAMADTSARVSNSGTVRVDSARSLSLDGGRLELQTGVIDGAMLLTDMHIGPGTLSSAGRLVLIDQDNVIDAPVTNRGVLELQARTSKGNAQLTVTADIENLGRVELTSSSDRSFYDAILRIDGAAFRNAASGTLSALPGTFAAADRRIELVNGSRMLNDGQVLIRQQATLSQADTVTSVNRGTLDIAADQRLTVTAGTLVNAGILSGSGTVDVTKASLINSGTLRPGASPGRLTIDGAFRQTADGRLALEIGGRTPATDHDALDITGSATLDGTLQVQWINGFFPADADSFRVLNYGARVGTFAQIAGGNLGGGQQIKPHYQAEHLTLVYQQTGNRAPVAGNDAAITPEDRPVRIAILRNDLDPDGDPIRLVALDSTQTTGRVRVDAGDSTVTYTPPPNFNGEDRFEYSIADVYGARGLATVTITVTPVNDQPRILSSPPTVAYVNSLFEYTVTADDPDGDALTYVLVSGPAWLAFEIGSNRLRGTPAPGDAGEISITIEVQDPDGATVRQNFTLTVVQRADLANLVVSQVQVPPQAFSGESLEIQWTVSNSGNQSTDAPRWWDELYFSADTTFDPDSDRRIARVRNVAFLLPGDSYRNRTTFDLPPGANGQYTIFVLTDADNELIEAQENDNRTAAIVPVTLSPMPDLRITAVQAPTHAFSGDTIQVTWTVENAGNGPTRVDQWYDAFYLSADTTLDYILIRRDLIRIDDPYLGYKPHTGVLQPGESYQATAQVVLPPALFGQMHLFVYADSRALPRGKERGVVYEHTNDFNNAARTAIDITLTPPPDLVVTNVVHAASGRSGQLLYVEWKVENQGANRTPEGYWRDRIFLSPSPVFHPDSARILGDLIHRGQLEAGDSYQASRQVYLPDGIAGPFYLIIQTDASEDVFEYTFEDNNQLASATPLRIALSPWPDLVPEPVSVPDSAAAGETVQVQWRVRNRGTAATRAHFFLDRLYLAEDSTWTGRNAQRLAEVRHDSSLVPAGESPQQVTVSLPSDLDGTYYLFVVADAGDLVYEHVDEHNNVARLGSLVVRPYPPVDLQVTQVTASASGQSGRPVTLAWTVQNTGAGGTRARRWQDAVYLSNDRRLDSNFDRLLATLARELPLPAGESYNRQLQATLPDGLSGDYYFIIVADYDDQVQDHNRADNILAAATATRIQLSPSPDLSVDSLYSDLQAFAGQPITLELWLSNQGAADIPAAARWFDAIYLSEDDTLDDRDLRLTGIERSGPLAIGSELADRVEILLPNYLSGDYILLYQADSRNDLYEHQAENDNVIGQPINIRFMPPSDLVVSAISVPDSAMPGEPVTVQWTLRNQGPNAVAGQVKDAVYVSADTVWDVGDALVGIGAHAIDLPPGASAQMRMKVNLAARLSADSTTSLQKDLPGLAVGDYHIIIRTDVLNAIREQDETNNTRASGGRVHVSVQQLALNTPVQDRIDSGEERYYLFEAPNGEDVQVRVQGSNGFFELYVRHGSVPDRSRYDFTGGRPFSAQQTVSISPTQSGQYYVLVRAGQVPQAGADFTIEVKTWQFSLFSVEEDVAGDRGEFTLAVNGARLRPATRLFLRRNGQQFEAMRTAFIDGSRIMALFDADPLEPGVWDVVARQADGTEAVLPQGLTVEPALPPGLQVTLGLPPYVRVNQRIPIEIRAQNRSNVNMERALVWLEMRLDLEMRLFDDFAEVDSLVHYTGPFVSADDSSKVQPLFFSNIGPRQTKILRGWLELKALGTYEFRIETYVTTTEAHNRIMATTWAEAWRQGWISLTPVQFTSPLGKVLQEDCSALQNIDPSLYKLCLQDNNRKEKIKDLQGIGEAGMKLPGTSVKPQRPGKTAVLAYGKFAYEMYKTGKKWDKMDQELAEAVKSQDPNDLVGPAGYGDEHWVSAFRPLEYTVRFENDPEFATAPAQEVRIELPLDSSLDARSFRLGPFAFANLSFAVPENVSFYRSRLDARDSLGVFVDVNAGIDIVNRRAFWYLRAIDPATGNAPSDPLLGLLPVNDAAGRGEGFVQFQVRADATAQTGDRVQARARIVFDTNDPIDTPEIFHTLDADAPVSRLEALPAQVEQREVELQWQASDAGAGLKQAALYLATDDGPYQLLQNGIEGQSYRFTGEPGHLYRLFVLAEDQVGNVEPAKTDAGVSFQIVVTGVAGRTVPKAFRLYGNYPNPFNPGTSIQFDVPREARVEIRIFNVLGQEVRLLADKPFAPGTHILEWDGRSNHGRQVGSGVYFLLMKTERFTAVGKMTLLR